MALPWGTGRGVCNASGKLLWLLYSYTTVLPIYRSTVYVYESSDIPPQRPDQDYASALCPALALAFADLTSPTPPHVSLRLLLSPSSLL